ncbi:hypothetical protein [Amycolatopsis sp. NPDC051716]
MSDPTWALACSPEARAWASLRGGAELTEGPATDKLLAAFFDRLADRYAS